MPVVVRVELAEEEFQSISTLDLVHPEDLGRLVTERYLQKIG
jgi:hypothetical protein